MKEILRKELNAVAEELNDVLGLEPLIVPEEHDDAMLLGLVREAQGLIVPDDLLTPRTELLLETMKGEVTVVKQYTKTATVKPEVKREAKAVEPEPEVQREPAVKIKITRSDALVKALDKLSGQPFSTEQLISSSKQIYEQANSVTEKTDNGAAAEWLAARGLLTALGMLKKQNRQTFLFRRLF